MRIIAFTGKKLNGKTTAANYLMKRYLEESENPVSVERINMKDSIIEEIKQNFPQLLGIWSGEIYRDDIDTIFKIKPDEVRKFMQDYGLMRRKEDSLYWVKRWEDKVKKSSADIIIVDDVRFLNEFEVISRNNGAVYKVVKTGLESNDNHATETEIDKIECRIIEAKDNDELFSEIDKMVL